MQAKSIAECSMGSILQCFRPTLSYHLSLRSLFRLVEWSLKTGFTVLSVSYGLTQRAKNCENTHRKVKKKSNKNDKNYTDIPNRHCNIHTLNHYSKIEANRTRSNSVLRVAKSSAEKKLITVLATLWHCDADQQ